MYNDEAGHSHSLMQQCQQANEASAAAQAETSRALERVEAAKAEAREVNMACMRLKDELTQARQESKDLLIDNARYELSDFLVIILCLTLLPEQLCCCNLVHDLFMKPLGRIYKTRVLSGSKRPAGFGRSLGLDCASF